MGIVLFVSLIIPVITIIIFSILIKRKKPDDNWNWWISFVSTIVSLMLGIVVGISLFEYRQNRIKLDDRARLTSMLSVELSGIYDVLSREKYTTIGDNQPMQTLVTKLDQIIINDAIRSNLFDKGVAKLLIVISRNISMQNILVDHSMASIRLARIKDSKPPFDTFIDLMADIQKHKAIIKTSIKILEPLLDSDLNGR